MHLTLISPSADVTAIFHNVVLIVSGNLYCFSDQAVSTGRELLKTS